jgi:hypothetical protein
VGAAILQGENRLIETRLIPGTHQDNGLAGEPGRISAAGLQLPGPCHGIPMVGMRTHTAQVASSRLIAQSEYRAPVFKPCANNAWMRPSVPPNASFV